VPIRPTRPALAATLAAALVVGLAGLAHPSPTRAATTVDLDQWASSDLAWQNGNLNGNNSRYPEGGVVPFRLAIEGLAPGNHSIHINHDFTAGGHKAYDFLATWDVTNAKGKICNGSGGAISSMCPSLPSPSSAAFPSDPYVANGLSVRGAEQYSGTPRRLTIWGGTITSIGVAVHSGSPNGNSTADYLVRFRSSGSAVLLAWGGHLAQSDYWDTADGGPPDGAAQVSGAPWHMRTLQLDGAGNKNQDRSIQPSAIVGGLPPQALAPTPVPTPRPTAPSGPQPTPGTGGGGGGGGSGTPAQAPGASPFPGLTPPATSTAPAPARDPAEGPLPMALTLLLTAVLALPRLILRRRA
jgi:hypothetical protein